MARPKTINADQIPGELTTGHSQDEIKKLESMPNGPLDVFEQALSVHMAIGLDLLGSQTSLNSKRGNSLGVTWIGIKAKGKSGRTVVIPYANVKGFEI